MSLLKQVKVGNITNLSEARYCAGMGVDYLSFPISTIDPQTFAEITGWVHGPKMGIDLNDAAEISIDSYAADFIELSIDGPFGKTEGKPLIVKAPLSDIETNIGKLTSLKGQILFIEILLDKDSDLTKLKQSISSLTENFTVFLKYPGGTLSDYLQLGADGISLDGNAEERPGLKEYPLAEILEKMEVEE